MICPKCGSSHLIATAASYPTWETDEGGRWTYLGLVDGPTDYDICCVACDHEWKTNDLFLKG